MLVFVNCHQLFHDFACAFFSLLKSSGKFRRQWKIEALEEDD